MTEKRKKLITALACGMGAPEFVARVVAEGLVVHAEETSDIRCEGKSSRRDFSGAELSRIEELGALVLFGKRSHDHLLRFVVGTAVLNILRLDPDVYARNLCDWVGRWTDGDGVSEFRRVWSRKR